MKSILIRMLGNIGDAVCAEPALREFVKLNPNTEIHFQSRCPELFYDYPGLAQVYHIEDQVSRKLCEQYKRARPDWVNHIIDYLPNSLGISLKNRIPNLKHIPDENLQELRLGCRLENAIALSINPSNHIREWSRDYWEELVNEINKLGYKTIQLDAGLEPLSNVNYELVGKTSIRQAATILKKVKLSVMIDSGLSHLSVAMGTPCVCLFGPVNPAIRVHEGLTIPVRADVCTHCFPTYKGIKSCPQKHHDCMRRLTVETVFENIKTYLQKG